MEVIVHCSDSSFGSAIMIDKWHKQKGWSGIGYHAVILNGQLTTKASNKFFDGIVETGRPFDDNERIDGWETGAHVRGKNDRIGVCLIGTSGNFTENQLKSLFEFCCWMKELFKEVVISQHSDHDKNKPHCAGLSAEYLKQLNYKVHKHGKK